MVKELEVLIRTNSMKQATRAAEKKGSSLAGFGQSRGGAPLVLGGQIIDE